MITKHLGLLAAGALLASIGGANAGQITLTDAELDRVSAGAFAYVEAYGQGIYTNSGVFQLYAEVGPGNQGYASAYIYANASPQGPAFVPHTLGLEAYAQR